MNEKNNIKPYEYKEWEKGIADSPTDGFADMRNCNIERYPGNITPGFQTVSTTPVIFGPISVTRIGSTDNLQFGDNTFTPYIGQAVVFSATGGGITAGQIYYLGSIFFISGSWQAKIYNAVIDAINASGNVTLSAGVTGNITSIAMGQIMDIKIFYPKNPTINPVTCAIDSNARVWVQSQPSSEDLKVLTTSNWYYLAKSTDGVGDKTSIGLAIYTSPHASNNVWLFAASNNNLGVIQISTGSGLDLTGTWTPAFQSFLTGFYHRGFVSQTGKLYFTDGSSLFGFAEVNGQNFAPGTSSTYSINPSAILLPSFEIATCLDNLGDNLMVGGLNSNLIYPWNEIQQIITTASSTQVFASYQTPLRVGEGGIIQMKNINNVLYVLAGTKGIIYYTSGYDVLPLKKIPEYITGGSVQWGGIEKIDGNLLFGFSATQADTTFNVQRGIVGKLFLTQQIQSTSIIAQGTLVIDQTVVNATNLAQIVSALAVYVNRNVTTFLGQETYYLGSLTGIDVVDPSTCRSDGSSYIVLPIEYASNLKSSRSFQNIGAELLQPLTSSQSIDIQYRNAINSSFAEINPNTPTFSATTPQGSAINPFGNTQISNTNLVQLKATLTSDGNRAPILGQLILQ